MTARPNTVTIGPFVADDDISIVTKVSGWGSAPKRLSISDKAQQDGGWDATGWDGPRQIDVEGVILAGSPTEAQGKADELAALTARTLHQFTVDNVTIGPRSCMVRVAASADPEWMDETSFTYGVTLIAPDPLKYGPETFSQAPFIAASVGAGLTYPLTYPLDYGVAPGVTPGSVTLANAGTAAYWPRLRIDGPVTNPMLSLVETGDWVRYGGTVPAGQHLDFDCANRRVTIGDSPVSMRNLVTASGSWLAIPPGGGSIAGTADATTGDAQMSVWSYEGAWS